MMIIDAQIHTYAPNTPDRPWQKGSHTNRAASATGEEIVAAMDKLGVGGAILCSTALYGYDTSYAEEVQRKHADRFAIMRRIDFEDPAVDETLAEWKKVPGAVAVRIGIHGAALKAAAGNPGLDRTLRSAARHGIPVNFLFWDNVEAGTAVIDRHPETRFVVAHLGILQPNVPPTPPNAWANVPKLVELARRPNAALMVSNACTLSYKPYPFPDIWDPLARLFDAWGFERCLWGSDWTRATEILTYEQGIEPFRLTDRLNDSERAMLMGGACAKVHGWAPKKG